MLSNDYQNMKSQLILMVWTTPQINTLAGESCQIESQKKKLRRSREILQLLLDTVSPHVPEQHYPSLEAITEKNLDSSFFRAKKWVKGLVELLRQEYEKTKNPVAVWKAIHLLHMLDGDDWMLRTQYHRWIVEYLQSVAKNMAKKVQDWRPGTVVEKELPILLKFASGTSKGGQSHSQSDTPKGGQSYFQKLKRHGLNHLIVELTDIVEKLIEAKLVECKRGETRFNLVSEILKANGITGRGGDSLSPERIKKIVHDHKNSFHPAE